MRVFANYYIIPCTFASFHYHHHHHHHQVMLDIVRRMGANYIQVLYDESTAYASGLYLKLQELASTDRYDICIAQAVPSTPRSDVSQYKALVSSLRDRSDARLVIVLLHAEEIDKVQRRSQFEWG